MNNQDKEMIDYLESVIKMFQENIVNLRRHIDDLKSQDGISTKETKPIILDNNPFSLSCYAKEFPENWEKIANAKSTDCVEGGKNGK